MALTRLITTGNVNHLQALYMILNVPPGTNHSISNWTLMASTSPRHNFYRKHRDLQRPCLERMPEYLFRIIKKLCIGRVHWIRGRQVCHPGWWLERRKTVEGV